MTETGYAAAGLAHDTKKIFEIIELIIALVIIGFIVAKVTSDTGTQVTVVILVLGMIIFFA